MTHSQSLRALKQKKLLDIMMSTDDPYLIELCASLLIEHKDRLAGVQTPFESALEDGRSQLSKFMGAEQQKTPPGSGYPYTAVNLTDLLGLTSETPTNDQEPLASEKSNPPAFTHSVTDDSLKPNVDGITDKVCQVISSLTDIPVSELRTDVEIVSVYGIDSLIQIDVITSLEKTFGKTLGNDLIRSEKTIRRIAERIRQP